MIFATKILRHVVPCTHVYMRYVPKVTFKFSLQCTSMKSLAYMSRMCELSQTELTSQCHEQKPNNKLLSCNKVTNCRRWQFHISCRNKETNRGIGESKPVPDRNWDSVRREEKSKFLSETREVLSLDEVVEFLREENAKDIVVIQVPKEMCYVDYFIVATAMSGRHLANMAEMTNKLYKQMRKDGQPFAIIEGKRISDEWQCIDIGNMVIHLMLEGIREEYQLEKLWVLGPQYDDLLHDKPSEKDILKRISMQGLNLMSMNEDMVAALGNYGGTNPWENEPSDDHLNSDDFALAEEVEPGDEKGRPISTNDVLGDDDAFLV